MPVTFLLGGARSGKSSLAVRRARAWSERREPSREVTFVATATAGDEEMRQRIERHLAERPRRWTTIDAPYELLKAVRETTPSSAVIVDCLSLWVTNRLLELPVVESNRESDDNWADEIRDLDAWRRFDDEIVEESRQMMTVLMSRETPAWIVSNDVGGGLVPMNQLGRLFRDTLGRVNAAVSLAATDAEFIVAGRTLRLEHAK